MVKPNNKVMDFRKAFEPIALLHLSQLCREMEINDTVEIHIAEADFHGNLLRLLRRLPVQVLSDTPCAGLETGWHVIIRKIHSGGTHMSQNDLSEIKTSNTVDARGSACPGPLLEAKKGIGKVKVGEVLEVFSNDPGTRTDIPAWAEKVGHEFLGAVSADGYDKLYVRRKK